MKSHICYNRRGPWPWSKWARYKRANIVWFHFYEESRMGKFIKGGEGNGELLLNGYSFYLGWWKTWKSWWWWHNTINWLKCTLKMVKIYKLHVMCILSQFFEVKKKSSSCKEQQMSWEDVKSVDSSSMTFNMRRPIYSCWRQVFWFRFFWRQRRSQHMVFLGKREKLSGI